MLSWVFHSSWGGFHDAGAVVRRSTDSLLRALWINAPEHPPAPSPLLFFPQWPNCINAARWTEKREMELFTCCDVLVPGEIPNWTLFGLKETKGNTQHFSFILFLPLKLEPNVPLRGWEEGVCLTDTNGIACREETRGCTLLACVCLRAWVPVLTC